MMAMADLHRTGRRTWGWRSANSMEVEEVEAAAVEDRADKVMLRV